jgi:hypothetical protein
LIKVSNWLLYCHANHHVGVACIISSALKAEGLPQQGRHHVATLSMIAAVAVKVAVAIPVAM